MGQAWPHMGVSELEPRLNTAAQATSDKDAPVPMQPQLSLPFGAAHPPWGLHLLVGGAPPSDQHHMEASEANDRDEEEASHTHDSHASPLRPTVQARTPQTPSQQHGAGACGQTPSQPRDGHLPAGDPWAATKPSEAPSPQ